jgi:hypothetical protein
MMLVAGVAGAHVQDPGGWSKAKWGMTEPQLLAAFGPEIVRLDPPQKIGDTPVHLTVQPFELARFQFRAYLVPDKTGRLASVLLAPIHDADSTDALFETLEQLLVQKYGRPWSTTGAGTLELQWTCGQTVITLLRARFFTPQTYVTIHYKLKSGLDKL